MKKYLLSSILLLGVIAGCDKETPGNESNTGEGSGTTQELTFDASFDNTAYKKTWESTDAILIMADDGTVIESVIAGADAAEFSGTLPQSESYYALYPAECNASFNNGKIMANIPGEQLAASSGSPLGNCFLRQRALTVQLRGVNCGYNADEQHQNQKKRDIAFQVQYHEFILSAKK